MKLKEINWDIFKEHVKIARKQRGYETIQIAMNRTGIGMLGKYESGYRVPTLASLLLLANAYNCCPLWLIGCTDDPKNIKISSSLGFVFDGKVTSKKAKNDGLELIEVIASDDKVVKIFSRT